MPASAPALAWGCRSLANCWGTHNRQLPHGMRIWIPIRFAGPPSISAVGLRRGGGVLKFGPPAEASPCSKQPPGTKDAQKALYDGRVESRFRGSDPLDRIESNSWARAIFFRDGSVSFHGPLAGEPAPGWEPRRFSIEVKREDVMRDGP